MSTISIPKPTSLVAIAPMQQKKKSLRVESIDLLRGLVMIIMALDHGRDFLHPTAWTDDPLNLATTSPALFLTRWITHFCAPVFVFLAGTSVYFQTVRKRKKDLSIFLLKRGLWLVFVELVIINFAFNFDINFSLTALQTIWAIGISMIVLGAVIWLPFGAILTLGCLIVLGHNSLDFYEAQHTGSYSFVYSLLHRPGTYPIDRTHGILVLYPFLPWLGLMMVGYCFGKLFILYEGSARRQMLIRVGAGLIILFILLRAVNIYGDPVQWTTQKSTVYTILSFININKYPPSLLYMCITIGPSILFLAVVEDAKNKVSGMLITYGRVPFLYYVLHFLLLHLVAVLFFYLNGHSTTDMTNIAVEVPKFVVPGEGVALWIVYLIWLSVVGMLYPVCAWFSRYKQTHKQWWLSYL